MDWANFRVFFESKLLTILLEDRNGCDYRLSLDFHGEIFRRVKLRVEGRRMNFSVMVVPRTAFQPRRGTQQEEEDVAASLSLRRKLAISLPGLGTQLTYNLSRLADFSSA